jgi:hypothetical protein
MAPCKAGQEIRGFKEAFMRKLIIAAALTAPLTLTFGASPAAADPQMLGVIETASAVPLRCNDGECGAELTSICLQQARAAPIQGYRYFAHNPDTIGLTGIRRDGSRVAILVDATLKFSAARGYSAVRVSVPQALLRRHGVAAIEISVGAGLTLVPEKKPFGDDRRLGEGDIELGAGPLRQTATAIVDRDGDKAHASQFLARLIDALPRRGRASLDERTGLWVSAGVPHAAKLSKRGAHRARMAYHACYRKTRLGDVTLRQCLGKAHDGFIQELNGDYWDAVKTGT